MFDQELTFPVKWSYKMIVEDEQQALKQIIPVLKQNGINHTPKKGNTSKKGKYITLNLDVIFHNKESMQHLSSQLNALTSIKYLL